MSNSLHLIKVSLFKRITLDGILNQPWLTQSDNNPDQMSSLGDAEFENEYNRIVKTLQH